MRYRRARRGIAMVLLVAAVGVSTTGMSPSKTATSDAPRLVAADEPAAGPTARTPSQTTPLSVVREEHCAPTGPRERATGATEACVRTRPASARSAKRATVEAAPANRAALLDAGSTASAESCAIGTSGSWDHERFRYCVSGIEVLYTLRNEQGTPVGTGTLLVSSSATLPAQGTTWDEHVSVTMTKATGSVTSLAVRFRSACTTGCTATKNAPWYLANLVEGQSQDGTVSYASNPAPGAQLQFETSYRLFVTAAGAQATDPNASWANPRRIRCDHAVGGTTPAGCAIPSVTPVLPMSAGSTEPGAAVAAYEWAQKNLVDGWGKGKPLTRSTSGVADRTARTCGGFTAQTDLVDSDSCGEFPFAETKEGGTDGDRCVEVIPNLGNGEWDTYVLGDSRDLDRTSPCVRAHVPFGAKQFADAQLAAGFAKQRVIDADPFEVEFTTPNTGPHGRCLDTTPAGALPNGDGWILNTTEAVLHVNKTTVPLGPPGQRPTRAQACVGRTTTKGTAAQGDITGWQDAQLFRQSTSVTGSLARCHLIANIIGGRGIQTNLVPCWQSGMNTGTPSMRTFEKMAQDLVQGTVAGLGADDGIFYQVTPVYNDENSTIPVGVTMNAQIERANGTTEELFPNVYIPNTRGDTLLLNLGN
ncbi:DNA/RNA non-specific endonuclease [Streptomyces sp. NPDC053755]|uniref:DNA/RNA non-specific endonuclease n=1 Tax=Streptomyces sp. NPDC053755 TaxID=3155815 RepID=UPI00341D9177